MLEQADKSSETKIYEGLFNKVLFISELESRLRLWPPQKKSKLKVNRIFYNFPRIKKKDQTSILIYIRLFKSSITSKWYLYKNRKNNSRKKWC